MEFLNAYMKNKTQLDNSHKHGYYLGSLLPPWVLVWLLTPWYSKDSFIARREKYLFFVRIINSAHWKQSCSILLCAYYHMYFNPNEQELIQHQKVRGGVIYIKFSCSGLWGWASCILFSQVSSLIVCHRSELYFLLHSCEINTVLWSSVMDRRLSLI